MSPPSGRPRRDGDALASYLIPPTMAVMAERLGEDLDVLCQQVRANTFEAFGAF